MGLIKAGVGSLGGTLADQWKEFFYCDALSPEVLAVKGQKRVSGRSSNTRGSDNIISNGSVIAVADGQCMMIVEQGKVVEFCAEPGQFVFDASTEPSIFTGSFGKSLLDTFKTVGRRFTFGGDTGKDQRVYYFNTKEIVDNKFGTATPIPFRVVDRNIGLDIDVSVRCNGVYSYKISDPMLFYTHVCGNVEGDYKRSEIDSMLKTEFISALQPAFARISELEVRPSALPAHAEELSTFMNETLSRKWGELRGLQVVSIAMNPISLPEEDAELIKQAQRTAMLRDPSMAAATLTGAQAEAMKTAAGNKNGAMMGFMGMGMAQQAGGLNAQELYAMGQQQKAAPAADGWKCSCGATATGNFCPSCGAKKPQPAANGWTCTCGQRNTGKFCSACGKPRPAEGWTCACGTVNQGKFCQNCGAKKPANEPQYRCDKCGWQPLPESSLPLTLPDITDFEPGPDGESPLARHKDWVKTTCPCCGGPATRETDTMPQWAGSSWYFLRYCDPHNDKEFASQEALKYWMPVDWYNGGMEHVTRHMIYSRFWHKFLYDLDLVPTSEPYAKRTAQGLILGPDGEKMSKSRGNVVDPNDVVDVYGADVLRLYVLFMGDYEKAAPWSESSVKGCKRFIDRIWALQDKMTDSDSYSDALRSKMHKTIKKVSEDIEAMKFNTAIAAMMTLLNDIYDAGSITKKEFRDLLILLYPFAPHISEELYQVIGCEGVLSEQEWVTYDEALCVDDMIEIVVQINGKVKAKLEIPADAEKDDVLAQAAADAKIKEATAGKTIIKQIYVPKKLVNFVVK